jgi:hypothetical protein
MKPRFIQENCIEGNQTDLRQANIVSKYQPDIIFFELPAKKENPALVFNRYVPRKKPFKEVERIKRSLKNTAGKFPYAMSDFYVWKNIEQLWRDGHNVLLFNIDGQDELRRDYFKLARGLTYDLQRKRLLFWVHCYLREIKMAGYVRSVLKNYQGEPNPTVAVFLQSIHWHHVKFLLKDPFQKEIWKYYFGRFPEIHPENIGKKIAEKSAIHCAYWEKSPLGRAAKTVFEKR